MKAYFLIFVLIISKSIHAQYSCATAIPITSGFSTATNITTPGTNGMQDWVTSANTSCGTATNGGFQNADVYLFSYTTGPMAGETFYFTINHNNTVDGAHSIAVWTGCSGTTLSGCLTSTYKFDDVVGVCAQNLLANTTYYIGVSKEWYTLDGENLKFRVQDFTVETSTSQPNNECSTAPTLGLNDEFTGSTRCSYTSSTGSPTGCGSIENDSWVKFVATASNVSIDYTVFSCTDNSGVQLSVFSGSCPTPTLIAGTCLNYANNNSTGTWNLSGLTPGQSYYIRTDGYAGDLCNYTFNPNSGISLPVSLNNFSVNCLASTTQITWETMSEANASHFEIEKSRDLIHWMSVGIIAAVGNSNQLSQYTFSDDNTSSEIVYYRLKQFDINGEMKTYNPVAKKCAIAKNNWEIYPNPSKGNWELIYESMKDEQITIQLFDFTGKIIGSKTCNVVNGTNQISMSEFLLMAGSYYIQIQQYTGGIKKLMITN